MYKIGNIEIKNRIVMAPMAGISNPSYMKICEDMGVGYAITELISSEAIVRNNKKTFDMLNGIEDLNMPVAVQIFGADPVVMGKAAKIITEKYKVSMIDINMGCPVPKVALHAHAGSALLKDVNKIGEIVKSVVKSVDCPVTVKIRSGWDMEHINAVEVAKTIENSGASAICVHARTRSQGYTGKADWNIIKDVKENVLIPVIGNGDVKTPEDVKKMLDYTSCDAVMIGRALLGNPWIIKNSLLYLDGKDYTLPTNIDKIDMCIKHLKLLCKYKNEKLATLEIRSHIAWYMKGMSNASITKNKIYQCKNIHDILHILNELREELDEN